MIQKVPRHWEMRKINKFIIKPILTKDGYKVFLQCVMLLQCYSRYKGKWVTEKIFLNNEWREVI